MSYFVCVENDKVVSVIDYEPNVPDSVKLFSISEDEYKDITVNRTHFFNTKTGKVKKIEKEILLNRLNTQESLRFLSMTDWKILRHIREKALGIETTMTEEQYIDLENERQIRAKSIVRDV